MKKKILIITFNKAHNYGAMLQEYALLRILLKNNSVEVLNYNDINISKNYKCFGFGYGNIIQRIKQILKYIIFYKRNRQRYNAFKKFESENIVLTTQEYNNLEKLNTTTLDYDVLITGSDQVWNPAITNGLSDVYTLNFGSTQVKKISYAASVGNASNIIKYKNQYLEKLNNLSYISVREVSAKLALSEVFPNKKIEVVLDPTLLLTKEEWTSSLPNETENKIKYILTYEVEENEEFVKVANYLSEKTGYKIVHFSQRNKNRLKNILYSAYTSDPFEFVSLIKNAEFVITTSFHATVFSIIFNKKFWTVPHIVTGSRVIDLLEMLNISNRAVKSLVEFKTKDYNEMIDYKKVNKILANERNKSLKWLSDAIID